MKSVHLIIIFRLLLGWLLITAVAGALAVYLELDKVDQLVMSLITKEASSFSMKNLRHFNKAKSKKELQKNLHIFLAGNFVIVELYDQNKKIILEDADEDIGAIESWLDKIPHDFPLSNEIYHRKLIHNNQLYLQVVVPLRETPENPVEGYLEGIYQVDTQMLKDILDRLTLALGSVLVAMLVTAIVLYPFILFLLREQLRFSDDLLRSNLELMEVLGGAIAKRDSDTHQHNYRVTFYAIQLAAAMGIDDICIRNLIIGAFLHDAGKIGIPDAILLKPGLLTSGEFKIMQTHTRLGVEIVGKSRWLQSAQDVIEYHHEKFNGSGYPHGLHGENIPLNARIFAVVDVFDALTSRRPYKEPLPLDQAIAILQEGSGSHFDPIPLARFIAIAGPLHSNMTSWPAAKIESVLADSIRHYFSNKHVIFNWVASNHNSNKTQAV